MTSTAAIQRCTLMVMFVVLLTGSSTTAVADDLWVHQVSGCNGDQTVGSWFIKNNTSQTVTRQITRWYENDGASSVSHYPVTVGAGQDLWLGCTAWHRDHVGRQSFSLGVSGGVSQSVPPSRPSYAPPAPPVHRPNEPSGFSDNRFRYLGIMEFARTPNQGGWTQRMSLPVTANPGMAVDTDYHQENETRGPGFHCCTGGATSPMTVNNVPTGFYVEVGGEEYYSVRDALTTSSPFGNQAQGDFYITLYCGPPWNTGCQVNVKVWVVLRPITPPANSNDFRDDEFFNAPPPTFTKSTPSSELDKFLNDDDFEGPPPSFAKPN